VIAERSPMSPAFLTLSDPVTIESGFAALDSVAAAGKLLQPYPTRSFEALQHRKKFGFRVRFGSNAISAEAGSGAGAVG